LDAIAASVLGEVELLVGLPNELGGRKRFFADGGEDAQAHRDLERLIIEGKAMLGDMSANALGSHACSVQRGFRQHNGELFSSVASKEFLAANGLADTGDHLP